MNQLPLNFNWTMQRGLGKKVNLTQVEWLAQQCPQTNGNVVFWAQNLHNAITNKHRHFTTTCEIDIEAINNLQNNIVQKRTQPTIATSTTIKVYPNPTTSITIVEGKNIQQIAVFNLNGKQVLLQQNINKGNTVSMNTSNLPNGVYLIKAYSSNGSYTTTKFIKQ